MLSTVCNRFFGVDFFTEKRLKSNLIWTYFASLLPDLLFWVYLATNKQPGPVFSFLGCVLLGVFVLLLPLFFSIYKKIRPAWSYLFKSVAYARSLAVSFLLAEFLCPAVAKELAVFHRSFYILLLLSGILFLIYRIWLYKKGIFRSQSRMEMNNSSAYISGICVVLFRGVISVIEIIAKKELDNAFVIAVILGSVAFVMTLAYVHSYIVIKKDGLERYYFERLQEDEKKPPPIKPKQTPVIDENRPTYTSTPPYDRSEEMRRFQKWALIATVISLLFIAVVVFLIVDPFAFRRDTLSFSEQACQKLFASSASEMAQSDGEIMKWTDNFCYSATLNDAGELQLTMTDGNVERWKRYTFATLEALDGNGISLSPLHTRITVFTDPADVPSFEARVAELSKCCAYAQFFDDVDPQNIHVDVVYINIETNEPISLN